MALKLSNKNRKSFKQKIKEVESKSLSEDKLKRIIFCVSLAMLVIFII